MKEITVHVISVLVVDYNCWLLFARLVCLLLSGQRCLITVNCTSTLMTINIVIYAEALIISIYNILLSRIRNRSSAFRLS